MRLRILISVVIMMAISFSAQGSADEKSASMNLEVVEGSWTGARLAGLPAGGSIRLELATDGQVTIHLLDEQGYRAFPDEVRSLFSGTAAESLGFEAALPASGDYYIVADNREGSQPRRVAINIIARSPQTTGGLELAEQLAVVGRRINQIFDIGPLEISLDPCGRSEVLARDDGVTVCAEYVELLMRELGDRQLVRDALLYSLLHEVARRFGEAKAVTPAAEASPPELAAALMILFNQTDAARNQAGYFAELDPDSTLGSVVASLEHPLNPGKARRILGHLQTPNEFVGLLQDTLLPYMRGSVLEAMRESPPAWTDRGRIETEIARREQE